MAALRRNWRTDAGIAGDNPSFGSTEVAGELAYRAAAKLWPPAGPRDTVGFLICRHGFSCPSNVNGSGLVAGSS